MGGAFLEVRAGGGDVDYTGTAVLISGQPGGWTRLALCVVAAENNVASLFGVWAERRGAGREGVSHWFERGSRGQVGDTLKKTTAIDVAPTPGMSSREHS